MCVCVAGLLRNGGKKKENEGEEKRREGKKKNAHVIRIYLEE